MEEGRPNGRGPLAVRMRRLRSGLEGSFGHARTSAFFVTLAAAFIAAGGTATDISQDQVLMLWGGVSPDGRLRLDPAFVMDAPEKMPSSPGPYRIEVTGEGGSGLLSLDFDMDEISDGSGGFLFMAPFREEWRGALERIVLRGPEGTVTLDRYTHRPMAIVIDRASGQIRAILRGAAAEARIEAMAAEGAEAGSTANDTRVLVSYGLPSSSGPPAPGPPRSGPS